jgi:prepilin-type N-terminal cleavage/methylation domain-containing protein
MKYPARPGAPGFTLIELLKVIALIGILAAIVIPTIGHVRSTAQRAVDGSNLREILKASLAYATEHGGRLPDPVALAADFPEASPALRILAVLARSGSLSDPAVYFAPNDPFLVGDAPRSILDPTDPARRALDDEFSGGPPLAWEFVGGVRLDDPPTTPVAFTRGLRPDGTWDPESGVYGDAGGFVALLDGSVRFQESVNGLLVSNASGRPATDIREAIPIRGTTGTRIYGTPPGGSTILGSPAGTVAIRGP